MEADVVIAVMGMTGVGKSSFIRSITGRTDIVVGHSLTSQTAEVQGYTFRHGDKNVTLIDTPGFDDTYVSDSVIAAKIQGWLYTSYSSGTRLNGIVYIHSIMAPRMQGSALRNLRLFRKLCGDHALGNVILATTFWDKVDPTRGKKRERELRDEDEYWGRMVARGSKIMRLGRDRETAMLVLNELAGKPKVVLNTQQEAEAEKMQPVVLTKRVSTTGTRTRRTQPSSGTASAHTQWYQEQARKRAEEAHKWAKELEQMEKKLRERTERIQKEKMLAAAESKKAAEKTKKAKQKIYNSHKCRCPLVGRPVCASCHRIIGSSFYRESTLFSPSFDMAYWCGRLLLLR
ncbi:P-loop containing nucleoside triphosphate hydrolase protein [Sporormia fimetaria CBS 119925]|uniref:P-loop containing nucleoside triphosphate hydrolase protein n=1 Tax=Sporormia fimetaria CBS 119925 TaxID=1340428 RepID=A0A6A6V7T7_9PLEO|nr:P-loop containing nucleoside triphosphate hydrolase protein [Sporormia fimetaria CBS 119925]